MTTHTLLWEGRLLGRVEEMADGRRNEGERGGREEKKGQEGG